MKVTLFTEKEKVLIKNTLLKRLESLEKHEGRGVARDINNIKEVFKKLDSPWDKYYRPQHKLKITSCINEFLYPYREKQRELINANATRFIGLSNQDKEDLELFDLCYEILDKSNAKRKSRIRFSNIFMKIERLKNCEKICLSRIEGNLVYKVGFIDNLDVIRWEVGDNMNLIHDKFQKRTKKSIEVFANSFTDILTRDEAKEIVMNCQLTNSSEDFVKFTKYLLN